MFVALITSCSTSHRFTVKVETSIEYRQGIKASIPKQHKLIGPPLPIELDPAFTSRPLVKPKQEKGGARTYVPPSYATKKPEKGIELYADAQLIAQAIALKKYAKANAYDTTYAFLVNMSMKSGKKRFYVVNLNTMQIEKKALVAHGRGDERFTFNKTYSNSAGSNCTSIGRYKIGKSYTGQFGLAFRLYGLDKSNNNAYTRFVVLHAMGCISYDETDMPICQSEGCPAVSPQFLEEIKPIIDSRKQAMLLWVFDSVRPK
jgi:hypothetical protein